MQLNIKNIVRIIMKYLEMNKISVLNNTERIDMSLKDKPNLLFFMLVGWLFGFGAYQPL